MADTKMRIKIRRDTSTKWASVNPILLLGEQGFETDTNRMKIGDGASPWVELPYFGYNIEQTEGQLTTNRVALLGSTIQKLAQLETFVDGTEMDTQDDATDLLVDSIIEARQTLTDSVISLSETVTTNKEELLQFIEDTRNDVFSAIESVQADLIETRDELVVIKEQRVAEIEEQVDEFDARKLPTNLFNLPTL